MVTTPMATTPRCARAAAQSAPYKIKTFDAVPLLSSADGTASVLATVPTNTILTAQTSSEGFRNVAYGGSSGWISQGATRAYARAASRASLIRLRTLGATRAFTTCIPTRARAAPCWEPFAATSTCWGSAADQCDRRRLVPHHGERGKSTGQQPAQHQAVWLGTAERRRGRDLRICDRREVDADDGAPPVPDRLRGGGHGRQLGHLRRGERLVPVPERQREAARGSVAGRRSSRTPAAASAARPATCSSPPRARSRRASELRGGAGARPSPRAGRAASDKLVSSVPSPRARERILSHRRPGPRASRENAWVRNIGEVRGPGTLGVVALGFLLPASQGTALRARPVGGSRRPLRLGFLARRKWCSIAIALSRIALVHRPRRRRRSALPRSR